MWAHTVTMRANNHKQLSISHKHPSTVAQVVTPVSPKVTITFAPRASNQAQATPSKTQNTSTHEYPSIVAQVMTPVSTKVTTTADPRDTQVSQQRTIAELTWYMLSGNWLKDIHILRKRREQERVSLNKTPLVEENGSADLVRRFRRNDTGTWP